MSEGEQRALPRNERWLLWLTRRWLRFRLWPLLRVSCPRLRPSCWKSSTTWLKFVLASASARLMTPSVSRTSPSVSSSLRGGMVRRSRLPMWLDSWTFRFPRLALCVARWSGTRFLRPKRSRSTRCRPTEHPQGCSFFALKKLTKANPGSDQLLWC